MYNRFYYLLGGGAVVFRSKTQKVTALSFTESEFFAAVSTAKVVLFNQSVLTDLKYPPQAPTVICKDNEGCIKIINACHLTNRIRHIDTPFFCIQDWKQHKDILSIHIPGILNQSDILTKPLGWVLHSCHACRIMGHFRRHF